jgi:hypothetical protein
VFWAAKVVIISGLSGVYLLFAIKNPDNKPFFRTFALRNETKKVFHLGFAAFSGWYSLLLRKTVQP